MIRLLLCLLLLPTLAVAAAPSIRIEPATPLLGKPLTIIIPLADSQTVLTGLPDLGSFEPLAPPLRTADELRLVVLPMRPGERIIPPFPLQLGHARQIETAPLTVTVLEGIDQHAAPAPLKGRPLPLIGSQRPWLLLTSFILALCGASFWIWSRRRRQRLEELPIALQLQRLQRRLDQAPVAPQTTRLRCRLEALRFGPDNISEKELQSLREAIMSLNEGRP